MLVYVCHSLFVYHRLGIGTQLGPYIIELSLYLRHFVKGEAMPAAGIPESLNVLLHELRGLGLSVKLD